MFGIKKNPVPQAAANDTQFFSNEDVHMHTMREDLNIIEGKVSAPRIQQIDTQPTASEKIFQTGNNINSIGSNPAILSRNSSSPFMGLPESPIDKKPALQETFPVQKSEVMPGKKDVYPIIKPADQGSSNADDPKNISPQPQKSFSSSSLLIIGAIALTVAVFGIAGYYFWITRSVDSPEPQTPPVADVQPEEPVKIEPIEPKFSLDKPNYFRVELNGTSDNTQKLFMEKSLEVSGEKITAPVEFVVVDEGNSPVPFSLFAAISGIKFSKTIMDNLGDYSLYFYNDSGNMRMGLKIKIKEGMDISKDFTREESKLAEDLKAIMLKTAVPDKTKSFKSGTYKNFSIRYLNLDPENTISVDYAIANGYLVIGTSMRTCQAILDK